MSKRAKRSAQFFLILALAGYVISYLIASRKGAYEPAAYGLLEGLNGEPVLAPKGSFGYVWRPWALENSDQNLISKGAFFYPLIWLDQTFWHTTEKKDSGDYPVRYDFDYDTMKYRKPKD